MTPPIGFALLTHAKPDQIRRLVTTLNRMFDHPPIVCHHDFSQCPLETGGFGQNISFVRPHVQTVWGEFSLVEAIVLTFQQLQAAQVNPDWLVLLSGADYPIKPASRIIRDLREGGYDAHITFTEINADALEGSWQRRRYNRYCVVRFSLPYLGRRLRVKFRKFQIKRPRIVNRLLPFSSGLRCFTGSGWFCANRRATERIVAFHRTRPELAAHYRRVFAPDESYFATILANEPSLKLNNNNWRYIEWGESAHPKVFTMNDLGKLAASSAHFARKFDMDTDARVFDELDAFTK
jgi:hypothetical protein